MKYNIWNKWDPLEVCMLGNNYAPEFFSGIDDKVADPLKRICEETLEDLRGFKETLEDFGVHVIQPEMDSKERFLEHMESGWTEAQKSYPRGPLQPRDAQLVLGNSAYITRNDHPAIGKCLQEYAPVTDLTKDNWMPRSHYEKIAGSDYPSYEDYIANRNTKSYFEDIVWEEIQNFKYPHYINSATAMMLGNRLAIGVGDDQELLTKDEILETLPSAVDFEIVHGSIQGHSDGNYHPLKPGAILSLFDVQSYRETYPGWDVEYLEECSWHQVDGWWKLKQNNAGKWWLAGEEDNSEFTKFVETWLQDWVGYVEESVFDLNVLMLDEHHCCVSQNNNKQVNDFLRKHNIEPVYVPFRHRFFWDGGLHCITLDLYRKGTQKDYF